MIINDVCSIVVVITILFHKFSISTSLATTPLPSNIHHDKKPKKTLFIFGSGNVAQAVIKCASQITPIYIYPKTTATAMSASESKTTNQDDKSTNDNGRIEEEVQKVKKKTHAKTDQKCEINDNISDKSYFDSIICTYNQTPPTKSQQSIPNVKYIPFHDEALILELLPKSTHILVTIPPQPATSNVKKGENDDDKSNIDDAGSSTQTPSPATINGVMYKDVILDSYIKNYVPNDSKIAFVSTTGVYGNHNGEWVDESSETKCEQGTKAYSYLIIEKQWLNLFNQQNKGIGSGSGSGSEGTNTSPTCKGHVCIFRCSGLYGNQFSALHTIRKSGWKMKEKGVLTKLKTNDEIPITSRVHLDDVGRAILAYMLQADDDDDDKEYNNDDHDGDSRSINTVFNLSDDAPASRDDVMQFAYALLEDQNINMFENQHQQKGKKGSERGRRRRKDRKRVSNKKMRELLEPYGGLMFSSFNDGLLDVLKTNIKEWRDDNEK